MDSEILERFGRFKLSDREKVGVALNSVDIRTNKELCEQSLVGKIFGENGVNFTGLKQTLTKLWCMNGSLKVTELQPKLY